MRGRTCSAVVTTVRGVSETLAVWCAYHLSVGFNFLFVYLDSPDMDFAGSGSAQGLDERVIVIECRSCGREEILSTLPGEAWRLGRHCSSEVMARQLVDAWHCMAVLAPASGVDWLLHLDADELFDPGSMMVAEQFFCRLALSGARCITFQNWEAVPESDGACDPFVAHTLFKKPVSLVADGFSLKYWEQRHVEHESYFLFYENGKAACRVELGAKPLSVHEWLPGDSSGVWCWASNLSGLKHRDKKKGLFLANCVGNAKVLHYPVYSSRALYDKYRALGNFQDAWFEGNMSIPSSFHRDCRDNIGHAFSKGGELTARAAASILFQTRVSLLDVALVTTQAKLGVCVRFDAITRSQKGLELSPPQNRSIIPGGMQHRALLLPRLRSRLALDGYGSSAFAVAAAIRCHYFAIATMGSEWAETLEAARQEVVTLEADDILNPGELSTKGKYVADRTDKTVWLNDIKGITATPNLSAIQNAIDGLVHRCAPWLAAPSLPDEKQCAPFVIGDSTDAMVAVYSANGDAYGPHVDNPDGDGRDTDDGRLLAAVVYLNTPTWDNEQGGHLIFHTTRGIYLDVSPAAGSLIFFRADTLVHEVRPAFTTRRALTVWYMGTRGVTSCFPETAE